MQRRPPRWLYSLIGGGIVWATFAGLGGWRRYGGPLLAGAAVGAIVLITLLALDISNQARSTGRRWWRTDIFLGSLGWIGMILLPATLMLGIALAMRFSRIAIDPRRAMTGVLAAVPIATAIASAAATQSILRRGGRLMNGTPELIGMDAWCQRNLGVWWIGLIAVRVGLGAFAVALREPGGFIYPLIVFCYNDAFYIAHALNMNLPGLDKRRDALRKWQERLRMLRASAEFRVLERRNGWIDGWALAAALGGMLIPWAAAYIFKLYDAHDPRMLWIAGLMFGLLGVAPVCFVLLITLPQGWSRCLEFWSFWKLKNDKYVKWAGPWVAIFSVLTVVSAIAVAMTGDFRNI